MDKLFYGDNLDVLRKYVRDETIDLCYIDPPFNSKRVPFQTNTEVAARARTNETQTALFGAEG